MNERKREAIGNMIFNIMILGAMLLGSATGIGISYILADSSTFPSYVFILLAIVLGMLCAGAGMVFFIIGIEVLLFVVGLLIEIFEAIETVLKK